MAQGSLCVWGVGAGGHHTEGLGVREGGPPAGRSWQLLEGQRLGEAGALVCRVAGAPLAWRREDAGSSCGSQLRPVRPRARIRTWAAVGRPPTGSF